MKIILPYSCTYIMSVCSVDANWMNGNCREQSVSV
jgi:hypothetical protein